MKFSSKVIKETHKMTKEIKNKYPEVDYSFQFGICLKYLLSENKEENKMKFVITVNDKKAEKAFNHKEDLKRVGYAWTDKYSIFGKEWAKTFDTPESAVEAVKGIKAINLNAEASILREDGKTVSSVREMTEEEKKAFKKVFMAIM